MRTPILISFFLLAMSTAFAQGVAINETNNPADPSAMLDVASSEKGVLIPRMTEGERLAIINPANGLLVYQTDAPEGFYYFNGSLWLSLQGHLELVTEAMNTGYRIKGRDPANYGDIGENAVDLSLSIGFSNTRGATGSSSLAAGFNSEASGPNSTAWGSSSIASGSQATAWGSNSKAEATNATSWGENTQALGDESTAWGRSTVAEGSRSTAWGQSSEATGTYATAWGQASAASGDNATAWGFSTSASGIRSTAWGGNTNASEQLSTAWGFETASAGLAATAWGWFTEASGERSTAWGQGTEATGDNATAWGLNSTASGLRSTAWGISSLADGQMSTAWGGSTDASGNFSTAWGQDTEASSTGSTAWGINTKASGNRSTAWGIESHAFGPNSTAWGYSSTAVGDGANVWGFNSIANGNYSTAFGHEARTDGLFSTSIGDNTIAQSFGEVVVGRYNTNYIPESTTGFYYSDRLFVIGNGLTTANRDALIVYKSGIIETFSSPGKKAIQFLNSEFGQDHGVINMFNENELKTVKIDAQYTSTSPHGIIILYDGVDETDERLILTANWNNTGKSRLVTDQVQITGGADLSETFEISATEFSPLPGHVVSIDPANAGKLRVASSSYDKTVAGIISGANGVNPGMMMGQSGSIADGDYPVALTGRVYVYASDEAGEIIPGDLLTTSSRPGFAMKVQDYQKAQGAIIGKAMTSIDENGYVLVLVNLQ